MQTPTIRYRFIPFRKTDIVQMCLQEDRLAGKESEFKQLCQMLSSVFHFEFHKLVESLKDNYAPIDPDADTRNINSDTPSIERDFVEELNVLLEKAILRLLKLPCFVFDYTLISMSFQRFYFFAEGYHSAKKHSAASLVCIKKLSISLTMIEWCCIFVFVMT
jgi:hypothetical protein